MGYKLIFIISLHNLNQYGLYFAATNRIKSFIENNPDFDVEILNLTFKAPFIINLIKKILGRSDELQKEFIILNGLKCKNLWLNKSSLLPYFFGTNYSYTSISFATFARHKTDKFLHCDLISAHYGNGPGEFAYEVSCLTGKPYVITYHGTDIHTTPFSSVEKRNLYYKLLSKSRANIFVSEGLLRKSLEIYEDTSRNYVIHNGIEYNVFKQKNDLETKILKNTLSIKGKVIAYAGNLVEIKNVLLLPEIFSRITKLYDGEITFIILGDGILKKKLKKMAESLNLKITFTGTIVYDKMPLFYSLIDVLVLPSKNEGMPLVLAEAIACGVNCVGSRVGGIPEVIGDENCFDLDDDFIGELSHRVGYFLKNEKRISKICSKFDLKANALIEGNIYRSILQKSE